MIVSSTYYHSYFFVLNNYCWNQPWLASEGQPFDQLKPARHLCFSNNQSFSAFLQEEEEGKTCCSSFNSFATVEVGDYWLAVGVKAVAFVVKCTATVKRSLFKEGELQEFRGLAQRLNLGIVNLNCPTNE